MRLLRFGLLLSFFLYFAIVLDCLPAFGWIREVNANLTRHLVQTNAVYPNGNWR